MVNVDETTLPPNYHLTTGNKPLNVTLARGENLTDADFGYTEPALGGYVFIDVNGNGIRDAGETAASPACAIELRNAATNALLQTVVSVGATGWFEFTGIVPGSYKVVQVDATGRLHQHDTRYGHGDLRGRRAQGGRTSAR